MENMNIDEAVNLLLGKLADVDDQKKLKVIIRNIKVKLDELEKVTKKIEKIKK